MHDVHARSNLSATTLKQWGVLKPDVDDDGTVHDVRCDENNKNRELLVRGFAAVHCRDRVLYRGGVYRSAALLSTNNRDVEETVEYYKHVFDGMMWMEQQCADMPWDRDMQAIKALHLWGRISFIGNY